MANDTMAGFPVPGALIGSRPEPATSVASTAELTAAVQHTLRRFLATELSAMELLDPALGDLAHTVEQLVLAGGKRLRPTFAYWGWRGIVGLHRPAEPILPALAALELMHTFALVHDDVMDASATRRGMPTAHRIFAGHHSADGRRGDPDRFGEAAAILVGDLCLVWADQLLAHTAVPAARLFGARQFYDQMRVEAIAGQYLDILGEAQPGSWSVDRALRVARHKTASYTVLRPLHFGAALAGSDATAVATAYTRYGVAVGEAFQLCDDLLGVYGDPLVTGKPTGDDLRTSKPTTLLMLARQLASPAQRAELDRGPAGADNPADGPGAHGRDAHGPDDAAGADVARLTELVTATGAAQRVRHMIEERVEDALDALALAPIDDAARQALANLARAATNRRA